MDDFFTTYEWKPRRYIICQNGIYVWIALQSMKITMGYRNMTREEYKTVVLSYPYSLTNSCKCKDCRYFRMAKIVIDK